MTPHSTATTELRLARFAVNTRLAEVSDEAVQTIRWVVLAVLGTGLAGAHEEGIGALRALLVDRGGKPEAKSLVFGDDLPATSAAQLNGAMCRALDYCDAMAPGPHFGSAIVPAAFAVAHMLGRKGVQISGTRLLEALVVGAEIGARFNLSERMYDGFDPTGIAAVFGATASAGRLLGLDEEHMLHALALAFNRCGGSFQSHVDGSLAVRLVQGFVAETGVWCAQMAAQGLTGPRNFVDGHYGFRHLYAKGLRDSQSFTQGLGEHWQLNGMVFKKYPSCGVTQGVTNQCLDIVAELDLRPEDLLRAEVRMPPYATKLVGMPFQLGSNPRVNAQFSAQYCVANALYRRASRLEHFQAEAIADPAVLALLQKVSVSADPAMEARGHSAVDLRLVSKDGREASRSYDVSPGFPGRGLSAQEHRLRFADCLSYASRQHEAQLLLEPTLCLAPLPSPAAVYERVQALQELADVLPFCMSFCAAPGSG
jgi:2-methylcitrate dehydratase PrpD